MKNLLFILSFLVTLNSFSQNDGLEICFQYQKSLKGFSSNKSATDALNKILNVIGASQNFSLISCDEINNALAITYKGERYILYDRNFLNTLEELSNNWSSTFILAHEIGHHINGHTRDFLISNVLDNQSLEDRRKEEIEADEFAGFIVSKLGAKFSQIQNTIELIATNESDLYSTHPSYEKRIAAVKRGFDKANLTTNNKSNSVSTADKSKMTRLEYINILIDSGLSTEEIGDKLDEYDLAETSVKYKINIAALTPDFKNPRQTEYTKKFGKWTRFVNYWLEHFYKSQKLDKDPFELEEAKKRYSVKTVQSESFGKSVSGNGSKNIYLYIEQNSYAYNKGYFFVPYMTFHIELGNFDEMPDFQRSENTNSIYALFNYIIDGKYTGSFVTKLKGRSMGTAVFTENGWKDFDELTSIPENIILNGFENRLQQKQNFDFINRIKSGNKLFLRFEKLFYWNGYVDESRQAWDTSKTSQEYYIPKITYEFDLTGSSKALNFN